MEKLIIRKPAKYAFLFAFIDLLITYVIVTISFLSFYRYSGFVEHILPVTIYTASVSVATVLAFFFTRVYRLIINKNYGLSDSLRIVIVVLGIHFIGMITIFSIAAFDIENVIVIDGVPQEGTGYDRFNYIWSWLLSTATITLTTVSYRFGIKALDFGKALRRKSDKVRTLVIGAGSTGRVVIDETRKNVDSKNRIVAFIDDDPNKIGGIFANVPVKGPISDIGTVIRFYDIQEVIIAISTISPERLHEIVTLLNQFPVRVRRMPLISEMQGPNDVRMINVDLNDLLYRDPIKLDDVKVKSMIKGKRVLVTGAGGSIGSELVRQIFSMRPSRLILFDIYENSTYDIQMELMKEIRDKHITETRIKALIGSTYNEVRVEQVIKRCKPDFIFHAAAYKHVPLMEDSPMEAIRTNIVGTYNVARMAQKYNVKKMVLVSTDKAVRPTNVMGATKAFAEMIIRYFAKNSTSTVYAAVRFGNVLGSNGSVVPLFKKQIEAGGPVTITDKNIIRYFMTIPEAVSLILQCGTFAKGGEIFILDMGNPVKILTLAEKLIRQAGLVPYVDIEIVETGLRPGEKLYEELLLDPKTQTKTSNKKIYIEKKEKMNVPVEVEIQKVSEAFNMSDNDDIKKLLSEVVKDYKITNNGHR